jgi:hypothetical protein
MLDQNALTAITRKTTALLYALSGLFLLALIRTIAFPGIDHAIRRERLDSVQP